MINDIIANVSFGEKIYDFCDEDIFVIHIDESENTDFDVFPCDFIGYVSTYSCDLFLFDSKFGFIKIDSLDISGIEYDKGVFHLYCDSYKSINL